MGNRAFITPTGASVGVSLNWNGGRDSVEAFLKYAELAGLRPLGKNLEGLPGFITVLTNFFGNDGLNVYLEVCDPNRPQDSSPGDNGVYVVDGFEIVERYSNGIEQRHHTLAEMLKAIDNAQPERDRMGAFLDAEEVPTDDLKTGDQVYLPRRYGADESEGRYQLHTVLGHGEYLSNEQGERVKNWRNGTDVSGVPYVDMFDTQDNSKNCNAYIRTDTARVQKVEG